MKLCVIGGAGLLGSTAAFCCGLLGFIEEIVLVDVKKNLAENHAMDMDQALSSITGVRVRTGNYEVLAECDLVLLTAGAMETGASSRDSYLEKNLTIVKEIAKGIGSLRPEQVILSAINPLDVLNTVLLQELHCKRRQLIGFSYNDTVRLRWALGEALNTEPKRIGASSLGEHGEFTVPLFDSVELDGMPLKVSDSIRDHVQCTTQNWFAQFQSLGANRTSGWTSGVWMSRILRAIALDTGEVYPCSVVLNGEYGYKGISLGVPVYINHHGADHVEQLPLTQIEEQQLRKAAEKVSETLRRIRYM